MFLLLVQVVSHLPTHDSNSLRINHSYERRRLLQSAATRLAYGSASVLLLVDSFLLNVSLVAKLLRRDQPVWRQTLLQ